MAGFKLGIVRLGRAAGKMKYALLDERDIPLVEDYAFEAHLEVNKDGDGAAVYAFTYDIRRGRASGQYLHDLIWERHCGGIAQGWKVIHKNHVTVDNRIDNLQLVPLDWKSKPLEEGGETSCKFNKEQSLYWIAVQQLHIDPLHEHFPEVPSRLFNSNGDLIDEAVFNNKNNKKHQAAGSLDWKPKPLEEGGETSWKFNKEQSLYWIAVQQLHIDSLHEHFPEVPSRLFNSNGDLIDEAVFNNRNNKKRPAAGSLDWKPKPLEEGGETSCKFNKEQSLYWIALQQLHIDPLHEHFPEVPSRLFNSNGDLIHETVLYTDVGCVYYECHYPPCTNIEKQVREFSICGRCQSVRYCGTYCQQKDWPVHKQYCRERVRPQQIELPPDR